MAFPLVDNFNSYSDGNLNGQGSWTVGTGTVEIQGTTVKEGTKAVKLTCAGAEAQAYKSVSGTTSGTQTFYVRPTVTTGFGRFVLCTSDDQAYVRFDDSGKIIWKHGGGGAASEIMSYSANQWYGVKFVIDDATHYHVVIKEEDGTETSTASDTSVFGDSFANLTKMCIDPTATGDFYCDYFAADFLSASTAYTQSILETGSGSGAGMVLKEIISKITKYKKLFSDNQSLVEYFNKILKYKKSDTDIVNLNGRIQPNAGFHMDFHER